MCSEQKGSDQKQDSQRAALDAIVSYMKLETTLAAGAVVLSATFAQHLYRGHSIWSLVVAWSLLGLSIFFGFLVHGEYITHLAESNVALRRGERMEWWALLQTLCLLVGFAFLAFFAVTNVMTNT